MSLQEEIGAGAWQFRVNEPRQWSMIHVMTAWKEKKEENTKKMFALSRSESIRFGCESKWRGENGEGRKSPRQVTAADGHVLALRRVYRQFTAVRSRLPFLRDYAFNFAPHVPGDRRADGQRRWERTEMDRDFARWTRASDRGILIRHGSRNKIKSITINEIKLI